MTTPRTQADSAGSDKAPAGTAMALAAAYRAGAADPLAVVEQALARAADPAARHVFITLTAARARAEAAASARRYRAGVPRGPLDGVPVSWKDLFDVAGTPTTAGSATRRDAAPADADAPCVARLAAAGALCVGKTNLTEFAFSGLGLNPHFGTPANPFGQGGGQGSAQGGVRIPGGSSSGAAVSVALGIVAVAMGTDTSGSIRIPAAFNGLAGFRPSGGRYPAAGVFPLSERLDSVGTIARTVTEIRLVDRALTGIAVADAPPPPALVVADGILLQDLAPDVAAVFEDGVRRLEQAGIPVRRRRVEAVEAAHRLMVEYGTIVAADAYRLHRSRLDGADAPRLDPRVRQRLALGAALSAATYDRLVRERGRLAAQAAAELEGAALLCPTVAHTAPLLAPLERDDALFLQTNARTLRNTMIGSFLDLPGLSLPAGIGDCGLPVGLLVSQRSGSDDTLLGWGETARRWLAGKAPPAASPIGSPPE